MYIGDNDNCRVRKVTVSTGIITTIAGTGTPSYSGDGGEATSATLDYLRGVAVDSSGIICFYPPLSLLYITISVPWVGNVYIADTDNCCIRKVTVSAR